MELMAVVTVVGILLTIAVSVYSGSIEKSRIANCNTNKKTIQIAIARVAALEGKNLSSIQGIDLEPYIRGGLSSLTCDAQTNPRHTYSIVNGVIYPAHNHQ